MTSPPTHTQTRHTHTKRERGKKKRDGVRRKNGGPVRLTAMGKVSNWYDIGLHYTVLYYAGGILETSRVVWDWKTKSGGESG